MIFHIQYLTTNQNKMNRQGNVTENTERTIINHRVATGTKGIEIIEL